MLEILNLYDTSTEKAFTITLYYVSGFAMSSNTTAVHKLLSDSSSAACIEKSLNEKSSTAFKWEAM